MPKSNQQTLVQNNDEILEDELSQYADEIDEMVDMVMDEMLDTAFRQMELAIELTRIAVPATHSLESQRVFSTFREALQVVREETPSIYGNCAHQNEEELESA